MVAISEYRNALTRHTELVVLVPYRDYGYFAIIVVFISRLDIDRIHEKPKARKLTFARSNDTAKFGTIPGILA